MNILLANASWYPSGGDWTYIESICKLYESNGHSIIPFAMDDRRNNFNSYNKYFIENINYNELNKHKSFKNSFKVLTSSIYSFDAIKKIKKLLYENPIDIAQLNNIHNIHTPAIISEIKKYKIPIVWRVLDYKIICPNRTFLSNGIVCEACFKSKYYNCLINKCKKNSYSASLITTIESYFNKLMPFYNNVDMYLFQSQFSRDMFIKYGFDIKKTAIIENPYDCVLPVNDINFLNENRYILYFGRISKEKGIFTLYDAMKQIPNIKLRVVGDGPELESSISYTLQNNIENIEFLGAKWGDELSPYIKNCEFVVVPSEWYEPNPYVILQSFSYWKPVVATNIGGLKDMVIDNVNGKLVKPNDSNDLSNSIIDLFYNKEKIIDLGKNARNLLETKYNSKNYYKKSMELFDILLKKNTL
jgi:glycosyltransferase involved in cell wall biosynthesis